MEIENRAKKIEQLHGSLMTEYLNIGNEIKLTKEQKELIDKIWDLANQLDDELYDLYDEVTPLDKLDEAINEEEDRDERYEVCLNWDTSDFNREQMDTYGDWLNKLEEKR